MTWLDAAAPRLGRLVFPGMNMSDIAANEATPYTLTAMPLTRAAFAAYGDVIELGGPSAVINQGKGRRYADLARMDLDSSGRAAVGLMTCLAETPPVSLRLMERHPQGNQVFMPVDGQRYLVIVAPAGPAPNVAALRAFLCRGNQGINYHRGTWHHPMIALDADCCFFEVQWQGPGVNCDEVALDMPVRVALAAGEVPGTP